MTSTWRLLVVSLLATTMAVLSGTMAAIGRDYQIGAIKVVDPWTRATPPNAQVAGGFMAITNTGATADRLIGGTTSIATRLEVHEMAMDGGVMKMRALNDGLSIAPGASVALKPGSYHIMLIGLKEPLKAGGSIKLTLQFEKAGKVDVDCKIEGMGAMAH